MSEIGSTLASVYLVLSLVSIGFIGFLAFQDVIDNVSADATTIYINSTGGGDYTSIQAAIDAAEPNDTIIVANGTYSESITVNVANITLVGNSTTDCKITHHYTGSDFVTDYAAAINITASSVNITGFNITVSGSYISGIRLNNKESSNSNILKNNITAYGYYSVGILLYNSLNNTVKNNNISTLATYGYGIHLLHSSDNNDLIGNIIKTNGFWGHGIYIIDSSKIDIIQNQINSPGYGNSYGMYLSEVTQVTLSENNIINSGIKINGSSLQFWNTHTISTTNRVNGKSIYYYTNTNGITVPNGAGEVILANCSFMTVSQQNLNYGGVFLAYSDNSVIKNSILITCGLYLYFSNNNSIEYNTINTSGREEYSVYLDNSSDNKIENNDINSVGWEANSIFLTHSSGNNIKNNLIYANIEDCIFFYQSPNNNIINNQMSTYNNGISGIWLSKSSNIIVKDNTITIPGKNGYGILLSSSSNNELEKNKITTQNWWTQGIYTLNSKNNIFKDMEISTNDIGIYLMDSSDNNQLIDCEISTGAEDSHGVYIRRSNDNSLLNCSITTTFSGAHGFYLNANYATITNSTISTIDDEDTKDIKIIYDGKIDAIDNCKFETVQVSKTSGGILNVKNYLGVQVFHKGNNTPVSGVDVEIRVNNAQVYASAGYGGIDSTTNESGNIKPELVTYQIYNHNNVPTEKKVSLNVKKITDQIWELSRENINMSTSHPEIFYYDTNAPVTPSGLKVTRLAGMNSLNISWDSNFDTIKYALHSNKTGQWVIIKNIMHPQNWTLDENLKDNTWYHYRIQAWDETNLCSNLSEIVSFYLRDIIPPIIPTGLTVEPIQNDDALKISWDGNPDIIVLYEISWKDPDTYKWEWLVNVSHPKNYYIFSHEKLINGTTHYFKIRAAYQNITPSPYSSVVIIIHRDYLAPEAPVIVIAKPISENTIELYWEKSNDLDLEGYRVYINTSGSDSGGPYKLIGEVKDYPYIAENLTQNTTYYFVVSAFDEANNTSPFSFEVAATTMDALEQPRIYYTIPNNDSLNISIEGPLRIIFSIPMNTNSVEKAINITPQIDHNLSWDVESTVLIFTLNENLSYNTRYTITIGEAFSTTGMVLENWPFIFTFKTEEDANSPIIPPVISITHPTANTIVKPGEMIMILGTSKGLAKDTKVTVILNGYSTKGTIGNDGMWSVQSKTPESVGDYKITATAGNLSDSVLIIVEDDTDDKKHSSKDKDSSGFGLIIAFSAIFFIIITILVVFYFIKIRKTGESNKKIENEFQETSPSNLDFKGGLEYKSSPELSERPFDHELTEKKINDEGKTEQTR